MLPQSVSTPLSYSCTGSMSEIQNSSGRAQQITPGPNSTKPPSDLVLNTVSVRVPTEALPAPSTAFISRLPTEFLYRVQSWLTGRESLQLSMTSHSMWSRGQNFYSVPLRPAVAKHPRSPITTCQSTGHRQPSALQMELDGELDYSTPSHSMADLTEQLQKPARSKVCQQSENGTLAIENNRLVSSTASTARGVLNYVSSAFLGKNESVKIILQAKAAGAGAIRVRDDGATVYCNNLTVLSAVKEIIRRGTDIETIAIIFDNACRYGYQEALAAILERCNMRLSGPGTDGEKIEALISTLKDRGLGLNIQHDGAFKLTEYPLDPLDQSTVQKTTEVLNAFLPRTINELIIGRYHKSFDAFIHSRPELTERFEEYPLVLSFFKKAFNDGLIDSVYIDENSKEDRLLGVHKLLIRQSKIPFLKYMFKNDREALLSFVPNMQNAETMLSDISEIDSLIKVKKIKDDVQGKFGAELVAERWMARYR